VANGRDWVSIFLPCQLFATLPRPSFSSPRRPFFPSLLITVTSALSIYSPPDGPSILPTRPHLELFIFLSRVLFMMLVLALALSLSHRLGVRLYRYEKRRGGIVSTSETENRHDFVPPFVFFPLSPLQSLSFTNDFSFHFPSIPSRAACCLRLFLPPVVVYIHWLMALYWRCGRIL